MPDKQHISVGEFLIKYWVIIVATVGMSTAWGATTVRINNLEDAVKSNAQTQSEVTELKVDAARIDERTKTIQQTQDAMQQTQIEQQRLLEKILLQLQER